MAYVTMHLELRYHPKLLALAAQTKASRLETLGRLLSLWAFALEFAPDGDLSRFPPQALGVPLDLDARAAPAFVTALRDCGWLDDGDRIHDWSEYGGRYVAARTAGRERMAANRAAKGATPRNPRQARTLEAPEDPTARGEAGMNAFQRKTYGDLRAALAHSLETSDFDGTHGYFEGRQDEPKDTIGMSQVQYEFEIKELLRKGREQFGSGSDSGGDEAAEA